MIIDSFWENYRLKEDKGWDKPDNTAEKGKGQGLCGHEEQSFKLCQK